MTAVNNRRIAKNTLALYVQMAFGMLIGLYTSRVILGVLGVEDFGIFNVVGGVVAMFGMLSTAMSSSTSRFLTFELGKGIHGRLKTVFSTSLLVHIGIGLFVCLLSIPLGLWFMKTHMQLPELRFEASLWVFYSVVLTAFLSVLSVPYHALIVAHERMHIYAYFSILDLVLKLAIVLVLPWIVWDSLKAYAVLLVLSQFTMQVLYWIYCYRNFAEVRVGLGYDAKLLKEMSSFAGWSLFGDSAYLLYTQGLNVLLNIFFGAPINAARGIAVQVQSILMRFTSGFQTAINPQITKSYAANELRYMHRLIYSSSKFSFFLLLLLSIPVFLETESLLVWWLKVVPDHTVNFVRFLILIALVDCLANPLIYAAKATGKIRRYQMILGSFLLLVVPCSYLFLKLGYPAESVFVVHLVLSIIGQSIRVGLVSRMIQMDIKEYVNKLVLKCLVVGLCSFMLPMLVHTAPLAPLYRLLMVCVSSLASLSVMVYCFALEEEEKEFLMKLLKAKLLKVNNG